MLQPGFPEHSLSAKLYKYKTKLVLERANQQDMHMKLVNRTIILEGKVNICTLDDQLGSGIPFFLNTPCLQNFASKSEKLIIWLTRYAGIRGLHIR